MTDIESIPELKEKITSLEEQLEQVKSLQESDPSNTEYENLIKELSEAINLTQELIQEQETNDQPNKTSRFKLKDYVYVFYQNSWYVGTIADVNEYEVADTKGTASNVKKYAVRFIGYPNNVAEFTEDMLQPYRFPPKEQIQPGTKCFAAYSGDGYYYEATIDKPTKDNTVWVTYTEYNDSEEVPLQHIRLINNNQQKTPKKKKPKDTKKVSKKKKMDQELRNKQAAWQQFQKKASRKSKVVKKLSKRESIFKSPESVDGKVGVTNSGKGMTESGNKFANVTKKKVAF
eukprot:gb/GECH01008528.1/.p1 GENE.gb/GECH01008528.1/~~gb/GECH01008528.1/.p1  ORF type:complete len:288 (+),score=73.86 gb/GECH01008528.1/:1-864(+)